MDNFLKILGYGLLGYLCGSLTFSLWLTHLLVGVDVRSAGSGHATTTNTIRQAGWAAGVLVLALDIAKGFVPVYLAAQSDLADLAVPVAAVLTVVGHCWPVFAQFRGGMGLATAGGTTLAVEPLAFFIALGILIALALLIKHSARAAVWTGVFMAPAFYLMGYRGQIVWLAAGVGLVLVARFMSDWNRQYRELWLDRPESE